VHRTACLPPDDVTTISGIPCTTVARTLVDLAELLRSPEIERALERAEASGRLDFGAVDDAIGRHRKRAGAARLRRILERHDATMHLARSELERRFLQLCIRFGLPAPAINVPISLPDGRTAIVDALWREEQLAVETDGRETHATRLAFERDRHRDAQLMLAGWRVVRFTWRQVTEDPAAVAATVRSLLRHSPFSPAGTHGVPRRPSSG
jgi:hypothetical protein